MPDSRAAFDVLQILKYLKGRFGAISEAEVHLYSYLSCLIGIFGGEPVSEWGYEFASTENGSPFSEGISAAITLMRSTGHVESAGGLLSLSDQGEYFYLGVKGLSQYARRQLFIVAATNSALAMPSGQIRMAIMEEPSLRSARITQGSEMLVSDASLDALHAQFRVLSEALGHVSDFFVPAVVWLTFLSKAAEERVRLETEVVS